MKCMKMCRLQVMNFVMLFMLCPFSVFAQTWVGTINNDWNTAGNWSTNAVPTNAQVATFDAAAVNCVIGTDVSVGGVNITNGYAGTISIADGVTLTVGNQ